MTTLIIPAAGRSTRYPNMRPKWLLTLEDGRIMLEAALDGILAKNTFERVIVALIREHVDKYTTVNTLTKILKINRAPDIELLLLDKYTRSQSETVQTVIESCGVEGPFLIKDSDNYFEFYWDQGNEVAIASLDNYADVVPSNKSYVVSDSFDFVRNIVEKRIVSNLFCVGGYGFASAHDFMTAYNSIKTVGETYVSHVIYKLILKGISFKAKSVDAYIDWGTIDGYFNHLDKTITVFCDVDGVLVENSSKFSAEPWKLIGLNDNIAALKELSLKRNLFLVITTSRPESERERLLSFFSNHGLTVNQVLMGLPHSRRILLNDFSDSNRFPTAIALNIERNSLSLKSYLSRFFA